MRLIKNEKTLIILIAILSIVNIMFIFKLLHSNNQANNNRENISEQIKKDTDEKEIINSKDNIDINNFENGDNKIIDNNQTSDNTLIDESKKETIKHLITFDSNGGSSILPQTIENNKKIIKPVNPTKEGYDFVEWTLNGKTFDFNINITATTTLVARYEKITYQWKVLWLMLTNVKTNNHTGTLSAIEINKLTSYANRFELFIEKAVPNLNVVVDKISDDSLVSNLTLDNYYGPLLEKGNINYQLNKNNINFYDSVIVIADMTSYKNQMNYLGLTWGWDRYSFIPLVKDGNGGVTWDEKYVEELFVHEWLHQIESWFPSVNASFKTPDLHDNSTYGFSESNNGSWAQWYNSYLSNTLKGGPSTGINPNWWQYAPTSNIRP